MKIFFYTFVFLQFLFQQVFAETPLRWGGDIESGAPFAFKDPQNPNQIIGFEVDIVQALAQKLKRPSLFVQNSWDGLIQGLERNDYDIVVNGLEITKERSEVVYFSIPYYITSEILSVLKSNEDIHALSDLVSKKVGTLDGSLAFKILQNQKKNIQILPYDEEIHAYNDLAMGRIDAVLLDEPIALYYAQHNSKLKQLSEPIGRVEYGIAVKKGDEQLLKQVNVALNEMIKDGELRQILEKWGLWNILTSQTWGVTSNYQSAPVSYNVYLKSLKMDSTFKDKLNQYLGFLPLLVKGALLTLKISVVSMILAIFVGLLMGLSRLYGPPFLSWLSMVFVEIVRGTPLLIQLYLIFYGLPLIGIRLDPFIAATLGLGLNYGACEAENYRAGILSVPHHQMDAALALGMTRFQALKHVILPQAMKLVIPPVTNDFIALLKDSSLVSVITLVELTTIYGQLASTYFDYMGIGIVVAIMYFIIGLPFVRISRYYELKLLKVQNFKNSETFSSEKKNFWPLKIRT